MGFFIFMKRHNHMIRNKFKDVYKVLTFNNSINTLIAQNSCLQTLKFIILSHKILSPSIKLFIITHIDSKLFLASHF